MKKIVIIGGCGYIGSQLFSYLTKKKYIVDTVDLEWFGNYTNPQNIKSDFHNLPKSFYDLYDVVIFMGGHSTVGMCKKDMVGAFRNNVEKFVALTEKLEKQKLIYASTYRLYIDSCPDPLSIYDLTKKTLDCFMPFSSLEFYSLRMATVNGYSQNLRVNQIINKIFLYARNKKKITLYNQHATFSVLGINDACRAVEQIIINGDKRGIYNLASFETNIALIIKKVSKIFKDIAVSIEKHPKTSHSITIDTTKFQKNYNFTFEETPESILSSLLENLSQKSHLLKSI